MSVGDDKLIKLWQPNTNATEPTALITNKSFMMAVDCHRTQPSFVTAGKQVDLWDYQRSEPLASFAWGADTINTVRFNQTETSVFAACGTDRTVILYDVRYQTALSKTVMAMRSNAIAWNPMEAFNFTVANEDHNCYTFDMRRMDRALNVFKDHVSAV